MPKYDFRGANIGAQTIIEKQLGQLQINSGSTISGRQLEELLERLLGIQEEILRVGTGDPAVKVALPDIEKAIDETNSPDRKPHRVAGYLKNAAETLVEAGKSVSAAESLAETVVKTLQWLVGVVG